MQKLGRNAVRKWDRGRRVAWRRPPHAYLAQVGGDGLQEVLLALLHHPAQGLELLQPEPQGARPAGRERVAHPLDSAFHGLVLRRNRRSGSARGGGGVAGRRDAPRGPEPPPSPPLPSRPATPGANPEPHLVPPPTR